MDISIASILARTISNATPIVLTGTGGILAEKSGIVNIGLEGMMLSGAFSAAITTHYTGNPWLGVFAGMIVGMLVSLLHAYLCITAKINHIVSGLGINMLSSAMTVYLMSMLIGSKGSSPQVNRLPAIEIEFLGNIPVVGEMLSSISVLTVVAFIVVFAIRFILNKMPFGIRVTASGESPKAAAVLGINVVKVQYISVIISGMCSGLAGAYLSISFMNGFVKEMSAGRGFIAIATIIIGGFKPMAVTVAGLLFGLLDALQMSLQGTVNIPVEFVQSIPYLATILVVARLAKKNKMKNNI